MIDIKYIRTDAEKVKENISKKFQTDKLILVDEIYNADIKLRELIQEVENGKQVVNKNSKKIGELVSSGATDNADLIKTLKEEVAAINIKLKTLEQEQALLQEQINEKMLKIPNFIDAEVPIGKDDTENVVLEVYGSPEKPAYEVPYHVDIMEKFAGIELEPARKNSGAGFYYLLGDVARLHAAVLAYARDFMIEKGFTFCVPPFMVHRSVVDGVMSFEEMQDMMYKIEDEDLYLIGTSEHSMISKFSGTFSSTDSLPIRMTSYSPCFRKEIGAHGIEERGVYRVHQFEKQEMIVICEPEESASWFEKMYQFTVELALSLNIPVRALECCSGDLADLKARSIDVEAWSPRQEKFFEIGSCSNMRDAQARRLKIKVRNGKEKYLAHTLNNTVVASPRLLIALLENNYNADGSVTIPKPLQKYMGDKEYMQ